MANARSLIDHREIQQWADRRGGAPASIKGTRMGGDPGIIRIDFPGYDEDALEPISWDEWFQTFDENHLALLVQDETTDGRPSRFNKLVARDPADERVH